jgi:transposase-like protein
MPKGYPSVSYETKTEILTRIKEKAEKVADLAKEYGIQSKNIYSWLASGASSDSSALELARVKRENEALVAIIGRMTADQKLKKNK